MIITIYLIGIISSILFISSYLPDMLKSIKTKEIKGVTALSSIILMVALSGSIITNLYFKNYPFVINDLICITLNSVILKNRLLKIDYRKDGEYGNDTGINR